MIGLWIALGVALAWVLVRRRLYQFWENVQVARRQVDIQLQRRAELAPRLAEALGDRLDPATAEALRGADPEAQAAALAALPPPAADESPTTASMRADLADIELRLAARQRVLAAENARYRFRAPAWIGRLVGSPLPAVLPAVPAEADAAAEAAALANRGRS